MRRRLLHHPRRFELTDEGRQRVGPTPTAGDGGRHGLRGPVVADDPVALPQEPLCHPFVWEFEGMDTGARSFNFAAMEKSNGFSILGGAPPDARSKGSSRRPQRSISAVFSG